MANQLASIPWVLDTPSNNLITTNKIKINQIEFVGYTTAATDVLELQDQNGRVIAYLVGQTGLPTVSTWEEVGWIDGLKLPVNSSILGSANLAHGKAIIYIR